jgi:sulfur-carrier protein adenylyltransferase/sulfurtransferase
MHDSELEVTPEQLRERMDEGEVQLVDVRTPWEREISRIEPSSHIPLDALTRRVDELDRNRPVIVYCHHGQRSLMATQYLRQEGYDARSLHGGIDRWSSSIDPSTPRY